MFNVDLVLEGGGMRAIFTAGVLDAFLEEDLEFERIFGVSAGACHACSFLSKQKKRAFNIGVDYLDDKRYCSLYSLITTGDLFGAKFAYDEIPNKLNLYDYETFSKSKTEFYATVTNCETGKAEYIKVKDMKKDIIYVRASSSLPIVSKMVKADGKKYLDGGISDSIPVKQALETGKGKCVVVLTQHKIYRKKPNFASKLIALLYSKYPEFVKQAKNRYLKYNDTLRYIDEEQKNGNLFVIRPPEPLELGRLEKNKDRLTKVYNIGYNEGKKVMDELKAFLNKE